MLVVAFGLGPAHAAEDVAGDPSPCGRDAEDEVGRITESGQQTSPQRLVPDAPPVEGAPGDAGDEQGAQPECEGFLDAGAASHQAAEGVAGGQAHHGECHRGEHEQRRRDAEPGRNEVEKEVQ